MLDRNPGEAIKRFTSTASLHDVWFCGIKNMWYPNYCFENTKYIIPTAKPEIGLMLNY